MSITENVLKLSERQCLRIPEWVQMFYKFYKYNNFIAEMIRKVKHQTTLTEVKISETKKR